MPNLCSLCSAVLIQPPLHTHAMHSRLCTVLNETDLRLSLLNSAKFVEYYFRDNEILFWNSIWQN